MRLARGGHARWAVTLVRVVWQIPNKADGLTLLDQQTNRVESTR